ncbi:DUF6164 family protein [Marinobacter sp. X15-166B]|uniref:DUF6164 family protein n=1 Tax=Marinobacter sp. X15-166B TaxID=1897620 RepID=UPI00085CD095|nr:DUF6164 family protein [Marinobacter sp. X15-166B]OEY66175.1 hypothetical protein BG841_06685 [Marinobacter sp. X15-166B]
MPHHLMNLRHVPEDEAEEIRALLHEHQVPFYETPPSRWGISMGGFWVHDDEQARRARALLVRYQEQRVAQQRELYAQELAAGRIAGFWRRLRHRPVSTLAVCLAILVMVLVTLLPFLKV